MQQLSLLYNMLNSIKELRQVDIDSKQKSALLVSNKCPLRLIYPLKKYRQSCLPSSTNLNIKDVPKIKLW